MKMTSKYTIISEETLEKLICDNCYNYLSFGTSNIGSRDIICGRCNQAKTVLPLFNENIENYLFPCINRFDKCKELLPYWKVKKHEKMCTPYTKNQCTECKFNGNGCQLYHHYLKNHPDNVLRYPNFKVYLIETKTWNFLYCKNNNLFIVTYEVASDNSILKLTIRSVGNTDNSSQYQFVVKTTVKEFECIKTDYKLVPKEGDGFEMEFSKLIQEQKEYLITCHLNVKVSGELFFFKNVDIKPRPEPKTKQLSLLEIDRLKEKENQLKHIMDALYKNLYPKLSCCNCGCFVVPPIYRCPSSHVRCEDCDSSFCSDCDAVTNWSRATDLEVFQDVILLPCRWNCENMLLQAKLRGHEKMCPKRLYKCVEKWCSWSGSLDNLVKHWHSSTPVYRETHQMYGFNEGLVEFYLIFDDEMFYWRIDPLRKDGRKIHVRKVSDISTTSRCFVARVFLTHKCDEILKENQRDVNLGGITLIKRHYFDDFGACKNYKFIFSLLIS